MGSRGAKTALKRRTQFGELLTHARILDGVTQAEAAEVIGVGRVAYANLELGVYFPTYAHLETLCQRFALNPGDALAALAHDARNRTGRAGH